MRVLVMCRIPRKGVSGGRLLAMLMARGLMDSGNIVEVWSNNVNRDLSNDPLLAPVTIRLMLPAWLGKSKVIDSLILLIAKGRRLFSDKKKNLFDVSIIVPEAGQPTLHKYMYLQCKAHSSRVVLLNFETPNWFNELAPIPRPVAQWDGWNYIAQECGHVLSISNESMRFAKDFYPSDTRHEVFYPIVTSTVGRNPLPWNDRDRSVLMITRYDPHKGVDGIVKILSQLESETIFRLVVGSTQLPKYIRLQIEEACRAGGIELEYYSTISAAQKSTLLETTKYLLFPSFFEGLGMPPIEALAAGMGVVAFDLPVLREISEEMYFVDPGDFITLGVKVAELLRDGGKQKPSVPRRFMLEESANNWSQILG